VPMPATGITAFLARAFGRADDGLGMAGSLASLPPWRTPPS
jgi:hypothetical protein